MILFRHHRGTLAEALKTVQPVESVDELRSIILSEHPSLPETFELTFKHAGYDPRIGWDTYYVLVDGDCVGMTNGVL